MGLGTILMMAGVLLLLVAAESDAMTITKLVKTNLSKAAGARPVANARSETSSTVLKPAAAKPPRATPAPVAAKPATAKPAAVKPAATKPATTSAAMATAAATDTTTKRERPRLPSAQPARTASGPDLLTDMEEFCNWVEHSTHDSWRAPIEMPKAKRSPGAAA